MRDSSITRFLPPREAGGPITCAVCGCRLMAATGSEDGAYRHFPSLHPGQDARGCRPECVDVLHDGDGRVLIPTTLAADSTGEAAAA
ncbi:MAG TPA: hypothetical protein VM305_11630 [Candidatus Limnocylindrales bacterium]|nr:hypothetical protein [Candidatus Limnocylindrales bacterium]